MKTLLALCCLAALAASEEQDVLANNQAMLRSWEEARRTLV